MRFVVGAVVCVMLQYSSAGADVLPDDAVIEVSAEYDWAPIRFDGQTSPVIGNAIHVQDRNGLFARAVVRFLNPPPPVAEPSPYEVTATATRTHTYYGIFVTVTSTTYDVKVRERTPEEIQGIIDANRAERAEIMSLRNYHTEVTVYTPQQSNANARGGSFNMRTTVAGNSKFSLELGAGYGSLRSDVCRNPDPVGCRYRFWGIPVRVMISLGRLGSIDLAYDYNFDRVGEKGPYGTAWDPIRVALTLNPIDRLFVRGKVIDSPYDLTKPGFGIEVGGRL